MLLVLRAMLSSVVAGAIAASALPGCAPAPLRASFHSPNPTERLYAIREAVRVGDQSAIPHIIEHLDSEDSAVRLIAISALERLTGETYGYVHYGPRRERDAAIARWVEANRSGAVGQPLVPLDPAAAEGSDDDASLPLRVDGGGARKPGAENREATMPGGTDG